MGQFVVDPTKPATMTYDEFLAWADEDTLAEWVDGRVDMASPASARHQLPSPTKVLLDIDRDAYTRYFQEQLGQL